MACGVVAAQSPQNQSENAARMAAGQPPIFRSSVTARTAKAINYRHRSGATKINFVGTDLLPNSRAEAKVESKQGYIEIEVEFDNMQPATKNGPEYLTYVLWAITPEGRASNLGEVLLNGTKSKLNVTTELQVFGLVVTAEPYFAVSRPSDLIAMENVVRKDTIGKIEEIDAKYELLQRGQYQRLSNPLSLKYDKKVPLELYEARNAVQIARATGADRFASETFMKAEKTLAQAEAYQARNAGNKPVTMTARETVQTAEDARAIAVKRQEEDLLAAERQRSVEREAQAESGRLAAQTETERVTRQAEAALIKAERMKMESEAAAMSAKNEAERLRIENDSRIAETNRLKMENQLQKAANQAELEVATNQTAAALAEAANEKRMNEAKTASALLEADRLRMENEAKVAAASAEADRLKIENQTQKAVNLAELDNATRQAAAVKLEAERLRMESNAKIAAASAEADRLKQENEAQKARNEAALADAAKQKEQLEAEKAELRVVLLKQFNAILQTQDTARGLIVNMSDVLFDTAKHTLRPLAREKLAKVAGIVAGHPGLKLDIEGHTDSVGSDEYNQGLSERRSASVRDYLTSQGMSASSITSKGMGESRPVATNDNTGGRQKNRRVEIVISGEVIGASIGVPVVAK